MSRIRFVLAPAIVAAGTLAIAACDGLKSAFSAHVDVVARAEGEELSVDQFADMLGKSRVPLQKNIAENVAQLWVSYHLLAKAAANNDTLSDPKLIDKAMWAQLQQQRLQKFSMKVDSTMPAIDTSNMADKYANSTEFFAARHILLMFPNQDTSKADSVRRKAESVRAQVNAKNFADMAKKHSQDGSAANGGDLGLFPAGQMVAPFEQGVRALKPGEVSGLVRSQFGYHIIKRSEYAEVKDQFNQAFVGKQKQGTNEQFINKVQEGAQISIKPNAGKNLKELAADFEGHRNDRTVIATSKAGNLTVARVAQWLNGFPQLDQIRVQMQQAPDSILSSFAKQLATQEVLLEMADSAKVQLDSAQLAELRQAFKSLVMNTWAGLGVTPNTLGDSLKTSAAREAEAAKRANDYVQKLLRQEAAFVDVPHVLSAALREKYEGKVNAAAIDRALTEAQKVRSQADSTRPPSAVPMPGATAPKDTGKQ
jgi:parvulin-like peptidyl-prolyl cis-trans isomerase-like protein